MMIENGNNKAEPIYQVIRYQVIRYVDTNQPWPAISWLQSWCKTTEEPIQEKPHAALNQICPQLKQKKVENQVYIPGDDIQGNRFHSLPYCYSFIQ